MKAQLILTILTTLSKIITPERMNRVGDRILDVIEDEIENDGVTDWKDRVILPLCKTARVAFGIKDED